MRIRLVILFLFIASLSFGQANNWLFGVNSNQGNPSGPDTIAMPYSGDLLLFHQAGIGITEDANGVSQWNDLSGNGNHSTQSTNTNKPTTDVNGAVVFDGVNDYLDSPLEEAAGSFTVFFVYSADSATYGESQYLLDGTNTPRITLAHYFASTDSVATVTTGGVQSMFAPSTAGQQLLTYSLGADSIRVYRNSGQLGIGKSYTQSGIQGTVTIGENDTRIGSAAIDGTLSLVAIYNRELNISEIHEVEQSINDYYSIYTDPQLTLSYSSDLLLYHLAGYGVTSDANGVSQWDDLSGNSNHSTQGTTANKPTLSNTDGSIVFDGTDDWLEVSDLFTNTTDTAFTLFIVAETGSTRKDSFSLILWYEQGLDGNVDSSILIRIALDSIASQSTNHKLEFSVRDEGNGYLNWTKRVDTIGLNTQFLGTIAARESSYADFKVNGLQRDTLQFDGTWYGATSVTKSISGFRGSSLFFNGKISLIAIYNRKLNISEITEVENAINTYFSIY